MPNVTRVQFCPYDGLCCLCSLPGAPVSGSTPWLCGGETVGTNRSTSPSSPGLLQATNIALNWQNWSAPVSSSQHLHDCIIIYVNSHHGIMITKKTWVEKECYIDDLKACFFSSDFELLSWTWCKIALCLVKYPASWWPCAVTDGVTEHLTLFTCSLVCMRQADQSCAGQAHFRSFCVAVGMMVVFFRSIWSVTLLLWSYTSDFLRLQNFLFVSLSTYI